MEAKLKQYGISEMTTNPQDFISRKDHARISDARVAAREADLQVCTLHWRSAQTVCFVSCNIAVKGDHAAKWFPSNAAQMTRFPQCIAACCVINCLACLLAYKLSFMVAKEGMYAPE